MITTASSPALRRTPSARYIPAKKLKAIETAVLAACDARDGVTDGVLDDPTKCGFDPAVLLCKGAETDECLTLALERWVEQGVAPEAVIATKRQGATPEAPALRTRPLCPYPQVARFKGSGSTDEAANFCCVMEGPSDKKRK